MVISGNRARVGGGIAMLTQHAGQALTFANVEVINNRAAPRGSNVETATGGGIAVSTTCGAPAVPLQASVQIGSSIIRDNEVTSSDSLQAYAGGVFLFMPAVGSNAQIVNTRVVGNKVVLPTTPGSTSNAGGGIGASVRGLLIANSEIADNHANIGGGVEIYNVDAALQGAGDRMALTIRNSTIAENSAGPTPAGGIRAVANTGFAAPTLSLTSTIVAQNHAAVDIGVGANIAPFTVQANRSHVQFLDPNAALSGAGNITGADANLAPQMFNGGPTRTQSLLPGRPGIDTGSNPLSLATDQRSTGFLRTIGAATDMGAFEMRAPMVVLNTNDSGTGSLRDAVAQASADPYPDNITFAPGVTGTITLTTGQIPINGPVVILGPGTGSLTIDGNQNSRVFSIFENVANVCTALGNDFFVGIAEMTLTNAWRNTDQPGGALYSEKSTALYHVTVSNSQAKDGGGMAYGALYPGQLLSIEESTFVGNVARVFPSSSSGTQGSALYMFDRCAFSPRVSVDFLRANFLNNQVQPTTFPGAQGGAVSIWSDVDLTVTESRFVGNRIVQPASPPGNANYRGGSLSMQRGHTVLIERSQFSGNSSPRAPGPRFIAELIDRQTPDTSMAVRIVNTTVSGNSATGGAGGGVAAYGNVALEIDNSTVANNSATTTAGAISVQPGATSPAGASNALTPTVKLVSTIVATNTAPDIGVDASVPTLVVNADNSLVKSVAAGVTLSGFVNKPLGTDPLLASLADNGGPTHTHALLAGSPAANGGDNPLGLATDQRGAGFPRVLANVPDIGAFESTIVAAPPVFVSAASRRTHGGAGDFDLPLSLSASTPTTEPRQGPVQNLVFAFDKDVDSATVTVTEGTATVGTITTPQNSFVVPLTGVANQQYVTVTLTNVVSVDGGSGGSASVRVGFLTGDVNASCVVTLGDLALVNGALAQPVSASNFTRDINVSGTLTLADKATANANANLTKNLPAP